MTDFFVYKRTALTGGGDTALDGVASANLNDNDLAFVTLSQQIYIHIWDSTATGTESSPEKITPDDISGNGRWLLLDVVWEGLEAHKSTHADGGVDELDAGSTAAKGIVELATDVETLAGTDATRALTPANLKAMLGALTDGGLLISKGAAALGNTGVLSDGEMIVGDGTTDPVKESGATLRTSIGVGTGDTPQFTGLKISDAGNIGSVSDPDAVSISASGEIVMNAQPAFLVVNSADQNNIATGGVTVVFGTEVFDQGGDFSANTFTAPVTGNYQLGFVVAMNSVDVTSQYYYVNIVTSNRTYPFSIRSDAFGADFNTWSVQGSILADMDANDTVTIQVNQQGGAAQTDLAANQSYFSGYLAC